jgi:trehalose 6-phosphate synthase/phosphatase
VPYASRPRDAVPPPELIALLTRLAGDPATRVAVVSGRSRHELEQWFGQVEGLWILAEHGALMRSPRAKEWELYRTSYSVEWKQQVLPVFEHFMDRTPGSFIEEKEFSLVWHYRMSDPEFGEWLSHELVANLEQMLAATELRAYHGEKSVEVKLLWANKGEVLARLAEAEDAEGERFCFAAGDDRTDEDLFERLDQDAWTVHIGSKRSCARYCLPGPVELREVLDGFAGTYQGKAAATRSSL